MFLHFLAYPDSTIDRIKLVEWGKRLSNYYGWKAEDFSD